MSHFCSFYKKGSFEVQDKTSVEIIEVQNFLFLLPVMQIGAKILSLADMRTSTRCRVHIQCKVLFLKLVFD